MEPLGKLVLLIIRAPVVNAKSVGAEAAGLHPESYSPTTLPRKRTNSLAPPELRTQLVKPSKRPGFSVLDSGLGFRSLGFKV